jgi:GntR family transcriptional repressor for pyruvate dehydrogenase complex
MIADQDIRPGQKLPSETELASLFGVGRSTVREAMKALALQGVVEISPGRGTHLKQAVPQPLADTRMMRLRLRDSRAEEVYEARKAIEVEIAVLAAQRATAEDLEKMESALAEMRRTIQDSPAFARADICFHLAVASAAKNSLLEQFYTFADEMVTNVIGEIIELPAVKTRSIALHTKTYEAIKSRNPTAARLSILNHMRFVRQVIQAESGRDGGWERQ